MSYALSAELQSALYATFSQDTNLQSLVQGHVYDGFPTGAVPPLYVSLGAEIVRDVSDSSGTGTEHDVFMSVITTNVGFLEAKRIAAALTSALDQNPPVLSRGRLVSLRFVRAVARRENQGHLRRIDMTFRARLEDN